VGNVCAQTLSVASRGIFPSRNVVTTRRPILAAHAASASPHVATSDRRLPPVGTGAL
jgi:hypothetical protein